MELRSIKLLVILSREASIHWWIIDFLPAFIQWLLLLPIIEFLEINQELDALTMCGGGFIVKVWTSFRGFLKVSNSDDLNFCRKLTLKHSINYRNLLLKAQNREWVNEKEANNDKILTHVKKKSRKRERNFRVWAKKTSFILFLYIFGTSLIYFAYQKCLFTLFMFFSSFLSHFLRALDAFWFFFTSSLKYDSEELFWGIFITFMKIDKFLLKVNWVK